MFDYQDWTFHANGRTVVARVALEYGHKLLMAAINDEPFDLSSEVARRSPTVP